jgi:hypothetical protein
LQIVEKKRYIITSDEVSVIVERHLEKDDGTIEPLLPNRLHFQNSRLQREVMARELSPEEVANILAFWGDTPIEESGV